ncbi:MAG TPA: type II secretion system protein GspJ [Geobacteraceae bacterium]|nr:type II secretion system protein GspJ [Geobacteraceae bacterium]
MALVLLVILSAALYGTYFSLMRGREIGVTKMEERRALADTLDRLHRELAAALFNPKSTNKLLHFVVEDRDFFGKPASTLDFTCVAPPMSGSRPASDQIRVIYKAGEKDKKLVLARQAQDLYVTIDPLPYPQMEGLEGFLVECSTDGTKWVRTWDTALNSSIPKYVRITLLVKDGEKTVGFSTIAAPRIGS